VSCGMSPILHDMHDADGNQCTTDTCSNGVCVHTPVNVDDNNACMLFRFPAGMCRCLCHFWVYKLIIDYGTRGFVRG
jgi:hypothetical protein